MLPKILSLKDAYGQGAPQKVERILIEFVSSNPTGPLHVGHGRGAAFGDALARLLSVAGHVVEKEYYVNDAGRQMDIIALSVWLRYLQLAGIKLPFPENAYRGEYVNVLAGEIFREHAEQYVVAEEKFKRIGRIKDADKAIDELTSIAKAALGDAGFATFHRHALDSIVEDIRCDLEGFNISFDTWFSENSLYKCARVTRAVETLKENGHIYKHEGAWWFRSSSLGDSKDRVVIRENGVPTYFASDIAYHADKLERGFDCCINIWGSDHHGYIPRVNAALLALGLDANKLKILLVQFAILYRGDEKVAMSTRSGDFVTLRELREEVGTDAARFFYVQRKSEQHLDFDLELAKKHSSDNPVYYVQYAHARICSLFRQAATRGLSYDIEHADLTQLNSEKESVLTTHLERYPETIEAAARQYAPHLITYYLRDLANGFHSWYNSVRALEDDSTRRNARLALCAAIRQVLSNGLQVIGVSAPEKM